VSSTTKPSTGRGRDHVAYFRLLRGRWRGSTPTQTRRVPSVPTGAGDRPAAVVERGESFKLGSRHGWSPHGSPPCAASSPLAPGETRGGGPSSSATGRTPRDQKVRPLQASGVVNKALRPPGQSTAGCSQRRVGRRVFDRPWPGSPWDVRWLSTPQGEHARKRRWPTGLANIWESLPVAWGDVSR